MKKLLLVLPVIALIAAGCNTRVVPPQPLTQNRQVDVPVPDKPTLGALSQGATQSIQINWNYEIADKFNVYRSTAPNGPWQKIISNFPSSAHTAVDSDYPKDASILYYRITSVDNSGSESNPSPDASVSVSSSQSVGNETASWKTYTNAQYGIEIKYPPYNNDFRPASNIAVSLLDNAEPEDGPAAFWIKLSQDMWHKRLNSKNKSKVGDACILDGENDLQCKVLSLNPYALLIKTRWASPIDFQYYVYLLTDNFELTIGPLPRDVSTETLNQILSTFKFTN